MATETKTATAPAGITQRWPTLLMIKLGRITMHRFTEALPRTDCARAISPP